MKKFLTIVGALACGVLVAAGLIFISAHVVLEFVTNLGDMALLGIAVYTSAGIGLAFSSYLMYSVLGKERL